MKFLDANIIAYAFYDNEYSTSCQKAVWDGGMTNTFALAEAFNIIEHETNRDRAEKAIIGIFKSDIHIIDLDQNILFETLKNIKKLKLNIFDAIHYTSAMWNECEAIVSYDDDFDGLNIPREEP